MSILTADMQRVASKAPPAFSVQVKDTQKRLDLLYDHLNNEDLLSANTIASLTQLAKAVQSKDYESATKLQVQIQTEATNECGNWMVSLPHTGST